MAKDEVAVLREKVERLERVHVILADKLKNLEWRVQSLEK